MLRTALLAALAAAALVQAAAAETVTASLGGRDVEIEYTATDLEVTSARFAGISLILDVVSTGNPSSLVVTLDRSVIDTLEGEGGLNAYHVLEDDYEVTTFEESDTTSTHRTLRIPVNTGVAEVEIVGEFVRISPDQEPPAPPVPDVVPDPAVAAPELSDEPPVGEPEVLPPADPEPPAAEVPPPAEPVPQADPEPPAAEVPPPAEPVPPADPEPPAEPPSAGAGQPGGEMAVTGPAETAGAAQPSICGPGTVLADDGVTCVLSPAADRGPVSYRDLVFGAGAGVVISLVAAAIMYGIGRAGRP